MNEQYTALDELVNTFQLKYESNTEDGSVNVDKTIVANHLNSMDVGVQRDENATEDQTHTATDGTELDDASPDEQPDASPDEQPDQNDVEYEIDPTPPQDPMTQTELVGATESLNMGAHEANLTQRFLKTGLHVPTTVVPSPQSAPLSYI
ncbi:hypothetical protein PHYSODRAFT_323800 [Phytophthora sojae]|uniref:Uncharacterized protein n=1 Tax=Phytophthora sojae (strain P6497) TaxID=1094619 RepID=G4YNL2_PHYSP|nr:hypothetical protein PHYSODRAFT_323800 [Phytophthora sojae]EGZ30411.1 hypothetical protein PHYSODRAFT_323800 [Phytophthora sojae]|eukprot:XP_009517686.1 hypothetical protein PHYSODRAFT_323800 [Phytophthora sojae]